jgi:hypothetical protein
MKQDGIKAEELYQNRTARYELKKTKTRYRESQVNVHLTQLPTRGQLNEKAQNGLASPNRAPSREKNRQRDSESTEKQKHNNTNTIDSICPVTSQTLAEPTVRTSTTSTRTRIFSRPGPIRLVLRVRMRRRRCVRASMRRAALRRLFLLSLARAARDVRAGVIRRWCTAWLFIILRQKVTLMKY